LRVPPVRVPRRSSPQLTVHTASLWPQLATGSVRETLRSGRCHRRRGLATGEDGLLDLIEFGLRDGAAVEQLLGVADLGGTSAGRHGADVSVDLGLGRLEV